MLKMRQNDTNWIHVTRNREFTWTQ